jgi:chromosome partitioning protein
MKTLVIASQKGGAGKTTFAANLAVTAESSGYGQVALIDTDPQASLADWWNSRSAATPVFVPTAVHELGDKLKALEAAGFALVVIDTPPQATDTIRAVIAHADLVLIPTRPSPLDLRAVSATVAMVEAEGKRMVFAINGAANRANITGEAAIVLSQHGTVAPVTVYQLTVFATSMTDGRTAQEIDPTSKAATAIGELWQYVDTQLSKEVRT